MMLEGPFSVWVSGALCQSSVSDIFVLNSLIRATMKHVDIDKLANHLEA